MPMHRPASISALLVAFATLGCDQGSANTSSASRPAATASSSTAQATAGAPSTSAKAASLRAADPKPYDAPEAAKLGTLPEGVGLEVGSKAPDVELTDAHGKPVELSKVTTDGHLMVVFYRGGW